MWQTRWWAVLGLGIAVGAGGCAPRSVDRTALVDLQRDLPLGGASFDATAYDASVGRTFPDELTRLRRALEAVRAAAPDSARVRRVLFERLPQGQRCLFGIPRSGVEFLREGILTTSVFRRIAVNVDHSLDDLERNVLALAAVQRGAMASADGALNAVVAQPADLYSILRQKLADRSVESVYVLSLNVPYAGECEGSERLVAYSWYFAGGGGTREATFVGIDRIDVADSESRAEIRFPDSSNVAAPFHAIWEGVSLANDFLFRDGLPAPILGYLPNLLTSAAVNAALILKESAFELAKLPLNGFACAAGRDGERWKSFFGASWTPIANVCEIGSHHIAVAVAQGGSTPFLASVWELFTALPVAGPYFSDYLNDPWCSSSEAPARRNFSGGAGTASERDAVAAGAGLATVYLTRGIHGGGTAAQGNALWLAQTRAALQAANGVQQPRVEEVAFCYGTLVDSIWSLLNLSSGPSYVMANEIAKREPHGADAAPPIVAMLAHSGGVQRAAVASRLLWRRDVFTELVYGAAGPSVGPAAARPGAFGVVLGAGEFRRQDFTSQFSWVVAALERALVLPLELPLVGPIWQFSAPANGRYDGVLNADIYRTGASASFTHHNPGLVSESRRDTSLQYYGGELADRIELLRLRRAALAAAQSP